MHSCFILWGLIARKVTSGLHSHICTMIVELKDTFLPFYGEKWLLYKNSGFPWVCRLQDARLPLSTISTKKVFMRSMFLGFQKRVMTRTWHITAGKWSKNWIISNFLGRNQDTRIIETQTWSVTNIKALVVLCVSTVVTFIWNLRVVKEENSHEKPPTYTTGKPPMLSKKANIHSFYLNMTESVCVSRYSCPSEMVSSMTA